MPDKTSQTNAATVYDLSDRTQIELVGADRAKFLHGFCTNDIKSLQPGQGCEALLTNIKGRVLGHLFVFAGAQSMWLDTVPGQETAIITHLDRYVIREDVQLIGRSEERGELFVTGNHAAQLLALNVDPIHRDKSVDKTIVFDGVEQAILSAVRKHFGEGHKLEVHVDRENGHPTVKLDGQEVDAEELGKLLGTISTQVAKPVMMQRIREAEGGMPSDIGLPGYGWVSREAFGNSIDIRRVDLLGQPGFLLSMSRTALEFTRSSLLAVGCVAGSAEQFETRRIEAGFPAYGRDITDDNLAQEIARTKQCISFTKGCYLGQEPIARLDAMGHTNRELRRVRFEPGTTPIAGAVLLAADTDDEAGMVTSVAPLANSDGETMTLGYLKTRFGAAEARVRVTGANSPRFGVVQPTPN